MAGLGLSGQTQYLNYNPKSSKKALSIFDFVNYVLGTSSSIKDALNKISKIQVVTSTLYIEGGHYSYPMHYFIVDKAGNSAVIEFVKNKMVVYSNVASDITTHRLSQTAHVLTNAPTYEWQTNHYSDLVKKNKFVDHNKAKLYDGVYLNGSGYYGLPGDTTPPSRYEKVRTLINALPKIHTDAQARYVSSVIVAFGAIVPVGMNSEVTLWASHYNLDKLIYNRSTFIKHIGNGKVLVNDSPLGYVTKFDLNDIENIKSHKGIIHSNITASKNLTTEKVAQKSMSGGASPTTSYKYTFE